MSEGSLLRAWLIRASFTRNARQLTNEPLDQSGRMYARPKILRLFHHEPHHMPTTDLPSSPVETNLAKQQYASGAI